MTYEEEIKKIAANIKKIRLSKGLTVQELAWRCDIERSNMSRIESGRSHLTVQTLCLICRALNIELSDLL